MNWRIFLKPTRLKIIFSILSTLLAIFGIYALTPTIECFCAIGGFENCTDYYSHLLIKKIACHCSCTTLNEVFSQYFWFLIVPFVLSYLFYSIVSNFVLRKK